MIMNLSTTKISFLHEVPSHVEVDMSSTWRHHFFDTLGISEIHTYIKLIGDNKIYLIIPLLASTNAISPAVLNLSKPFLINNNSNSILITKFILDQFKNSGFSLNEKTPVTFAFKFKRVWISSSF
jgi:hypothetical protein